MLRILGLALLVMTLAACGSESTAEEPAPSGGTTTAGQSLTVEMYKDPT